MASGLGFGCVYIATNLYVAECAPTRLRGSFVGTVAQFGYQLGTLIAFWAGYGMSFHKSPYNIAWRVSNIIQIPIGLTFILVSFFYPESPRHLLERYPESPDRVLLVLARLRSSSPTDEAVRAEFHELVASREYRRRYDPGYVGLFKNKAMRKRLLLGFYAAGLQQVSQTGASTALKPTTTLHYVLSLQGLIHLGTVWRHCSAHHVCCSDIPKPWMGLGFAGIGHQWHPSRSATADRPSQHFYGGPFRPQNASFGGICHSGTRIADFGLLGYGLPR